MVLMLDEVFGEKKFVNEIIWCYKENEAVEKYFPRKHDNILMYSKREDDYKFTPVRSGITEAQRKRYNIVDKDGNRFANMKGKIRALNMDGAKMRSWWEIPIVQSSERIGYVTQKPEELLERIIQCSTNEGDVVLDCFGGGTTAVVAAKLNRRFITGDVSPVAVRVISDRLNKTADAPKFEVLNVPLTKTEWLEMDGHIFAEKICEFMGWECNPKKSSDGGVDGWANKKSVPIEIKNHRKSIGINPIKKLCSSLGRGKEGIFVAWQFTRTDEEYRAQVLRDEGKEITFITVAEILGSILIDNEEKSKLDKLYSKYNKVA